MSSYLFRLAHLAFRRRRLVLAIWLAGAIAAIVIGQAAAERSTTLSMQDTGGVGAGAICGRPSSASTVSGSDGQARSSGGDQTAQPDR